MNLIYRAPLRLLQYHKEYIWRANNVPFLDLVLVTQYVWFMKNHQAVYSYGTCTFLYVLLKELT